MRPSLISIVFLCLGHFCMGQPFDRTALYYDALDSLERIEQVRFIDGGMEALIHLNSGSVQVKRTTEQRNDTTVLSTSYGFLKYPNEFFKQYNRKNYFSIVEWEDTVQIYWGERWPISDSILWEMDTIVNAKTYQYIEHISRNYSKLRTRMILNAEIDTSGAVYEYIETDKAYFLNDTLLRFEGVNAESMVKFRVGLHYTPNQIELTKAWVSQDGTLKQGISDLIHFTADTSFVYERHYGSENTYKNHYWLTDTALTYFSEDHWTRYLYAPGTNIMQAFLMDQTVFFDLPTATIRYAHLLDRNPYKVISSSGNIALINVTTDSQGYPTSMTRTTEGKVLRRMELLRD